MLECVIPPERRTSPAKTSHSASEKRRTLRSIFSSWTNRLAESVGSATRSFALHLSDGSYAGNEANAVFRAYTFTLFTLFKFNVMFTKDNRCLQRHKCIDQISSQDSRSGVAPDEAALPVPSDRAPAAAALQA